MKVRTKLVLLSAILVVACGLGLMGLLAALVSTRFLDIERSLARRDMERVSRAVQREVDSLGTLTEDWAHWDDLWRYTQGGAPRFEQVNLNPETFGNAHLAFIAIYDAGGVRRYAATFREGRGLGDCAFFPPRAPAGGLPAFAAAPAGILSTPEGLMLAVASAIHRSDHSGPAAGLIVMGRRLDEGLLGSLARQTEVSFSHSFRDFSGPQDTVQADPDGRRLHVSRVFLTTDGVPALAIRTDTDRPIAAAGRSIALSFAAYSLVLAGLVWTITWLAFRNWVSRPLHQVESSLGRLDLDGGGGRNRDLLGSLPEGDDELGRIVGVLKGMYDRMQESHSRATQLNEALETEVEARTEALIRAHQRLLLYGKILENTSEGMVITDPAGTIIEVNDAMCRQTGYAREQLIGQNPRILKSSRHGPEFYQHLWAELLGTGYWSGEIWDRKPDGGIYPKWLTINAIPTQEGTVSHYVGLSIDISAIKSAEERLHQMAYYDQLTGLPNRALFNDRLRRTVLRIQRRQLQAALLFLDLDRFKNINDTLGHTVGDALLVQVAERIRHRLRESDTVCRMGGDEFTVILSEIARLEDAGQVAGELIEALSKRFDIEGSEIYVGASVGIALCPRDGLDEETLIKKADAAMYAAKEAGRCTFRFASGELDATSRKRMEIEARLHGAVERGEMVLHYQPLARTAEAAPGRPVGLVGAEALVRWVPEPGVMVGPGTFIQIAEDAGLIGELGEWVIREACRQAREWLDAGLALSVSVNVSARQFENDRLTGVVREALAMAGLPPSLLRLEITESTFMRNMDRVIGIMDGLRALGVLFSIDDFGTGFSSLQYIKCLPAQCLKIDKAFVSGVAASLSDGEVVSAIIALARAFGLKSTAEGVETEDQLRELRDRGCDEVQGYLVARPMPAPEFLRFALQGTPACQSAP